MPYVLCADVGGTNSRLQLHGTAPDAAPPADGWKHSDFAMVGEHIFPSADFTSLGGLVEAFLAKLKFTDVVDTACIAVCGPVEGEERMCGPILPEQPPTQWNAQASDVVTGRLEGRVRKAVMVNDFIAVGFGLTALAPEDVVTLHGAAPEPRAPIACVGAGTGLGEVFLVWDGGRGQYQACSSEGGMTAFNPQTELDWGLRSFCLAQNNCATVESVVSGPGLRNTFNYLVSTGKPDTISGSVDPENLPRAIAEAALAKTDPVAVEALRVMLEAWAAECRSVSLRIMPFNGLYLAGGLAPKLLPAIQEILVPAFLEGDPLMASVHTRCPLYAVTNESVGLLGAKVRATQLLPK